LVGSTKAHHNAELTMKALLIATAALLVSMPALAQQHNHPGQHEGHEQRMGMMAEHCPMMGVAQPAMILRHVDDLGLSQDQVRRIEAIRDRADGAAHMQGAMATHRQAAELLRADQPDLAAYEARLRQAADHMVQAHTSMARTAVDARAILTPEQRASLAGMAHGTMGHGAMGHGAGHGHGAMGEGHAGMTMGCPMMGGQQSPSDGGAGHHDH
jgi:Spy/CpxP family protein refolding chaperone